MVIETFQKKDRVEILTAAINIRDPLPGLSRIIEVKHRGNGVHAQTVDVIFIEPEKRIADEEIADFAAAIIENERPPILVFALARVHVLVEIGAIEFGKRMRILREMRRHPIHDDADARPVTCVDKMTEFVGRAEAAGGRVIICDLITPGAFKWMLGDGQQLDVGVTHLHYVRDQSLRQFKIAKVTVSFVSPASPRAEVHFVNADRALRPIPSPPRFHPLGVAPLITIEIINERTGR
jgi:hypothetical protein